jgi:hypothetical protein
VSREKLALGRYKFTDNYYFTIISEELKERVLELITEFFPISKTYPNHKVILGNATSINDSLDKNSTLQDALLLDGLFGYQVNVFIENNGARDAEFKKTATEMIKAYDSRIDSLDNLLFCVYLLNNADYEDSTEEDPMGFTDKYPFPSQEDFAVVASTEVKEND